MVHTEHEKSNHLEDPYMILPQAQPPPPQLAQLLDPRNEQLLNHRVYNPRTMSGRLQSLARGPPGYSTSSPMPTILSGASRPPKGHHATGPADRPIHASTATDGGQGKARPGQASTRPATYKSTNLLVSQPIHCTPTRQATAT